MPRPRPEFLSDDFATDQEVQKSKMGYAVASNVGNDYTAIYNPVITSYSEGEHLIFKAVNTNTGSVRFNAGAGLVTVKKNKTHDLTADDIQAGQLVEVFHDGTYWQITGSSLQGGTNQLIWSDITTDTLASINHGYFTNSINRINVTLPVTAFVGEQIALVNKSGGWKLLQNDYQKIRFGDKTTLEGIDGFIQSTDVNDSAYIMCIKDNTDWRVSSENLLEMNV